jgi:hypothetical protein
MTADAADAPQITRLITEEIKQLRKGRGVHTPDLGRRLGPHLRELASADGNADTAGLRASLISELGSRATELTNEMSTAILAGLGLSAGARNMATFEDRAAWLAAQIGYGQRTALRRIDDAGQLLAEEIANELQRRRGLTATAPQGWYLEELRTLLRLDTPTPQADEHRRIVATRPGLQEVMAWLDIPRSPGQDRTDVSAEVSYGGRLLRKERPGPNRFQLVVQLPRPLQPGDRYEYGLVLRMPEGVDMRPHYIFTPEYRCDSFDLRVRFDLQHPPKWVRRVEGETVRVFDDAQPAGDLVPDDAGELHLEFRKPTMYLGYGVQWRL